MDIENLSGRDVVVTGAASRIGGLFVEIPLEEWDSVLAINLKGVVNGSALRHRSAYEGRY